MEAAATTPDKKAEQNRARVAKFYAKNKEEVNAARRAKYLASKLDAVPAPAAAAVEAVPAIEATNQLLLAKLDTLGLGAATLRSYQYSLNKVFSLIGNEQLIPFLRQGQRLIDIISATDLSTNTKRGLIQICLYIITKYGLKINKKSIDLMTAYFGRLKEEAAKEVEAKRESAEDAVISWDEYMRRVREKFGVESQMFAIASLYRELTMRDDFTLKIVAKRPKDVSENYLVLTKRNLTVVVHNHKTANYYGSAIAKLSIPLSRLLNEYMQRNSLQIGDYLFGTAPLSQTIIRNNKQIGVNGGISMFRHMTVSESRSNPALAKKMAHSLRMQEEYRRQVAV